MSKFRGIGASADMVPVHGHTQKKTRLINEEEFFSKKRVPASHGISESSVWHIFSVLWDSGCQIHHQRSKRLPSCCLLSCCLGLALMYVSKFITDFQTYQTGFHLISSLNWKLLLISWYISDSRQVIWLPWTGDAQGLGMFAVCSFLSRSPKTCGVCLGVFKVIWEFWLWKEVGAIFFLV